MSSPSTDQTELIFQGAGEMTARCRAFDWSATPVGASPSWPSSLRTAAQMVLASPFPSVLLWGDDLIQIYNDGYQELMGNKHPTGLGQPTKQCWPEVWHINQPIYERVWGGESFSFADALYPITRSGQLEDAWFTLAYSPVRDESGQVEGVLVTVFETTRRVLEERQRQSVQQALHQSEQRFSLLVKATSEMVYTMSADWQHMLHMDGKDYLTSTNTANESWMNHYLPAHEQERIWATIQQAIDQRLPFQAEHQVIRQDGSLGWVNSRAIPILDEAGQIQQWLGAASDITEQKKMEASLRANQERPTFLLRLSDTLRAEKGMEAVGNRAVQMIAQQLGVDRVYLVTLNPGDDNIVVTHEARRSDMLPMLGSYRGSDFPTAIQEIFHRTIVYTDVRTDGRLTDLDRLSFAGLGAVGFMAVPIRRGSQTMIWAAGAVSTQPRCWTETDIAVFEDAVERTWAAVERARVEEALHQADRRKDEFLAMLAHELRNPLAPVRNGLQLMAQTHAQDELLSTMLPILNRQMDHLMHMVDDLLDVSRISQGKIELHKQRLDLVQVVDQTVQAMQPLYTASGRQLSTQLPDAPLYVDGDGTRLNQVVANLLSNGLRYTHAGGQVWLSVERLGEQALLRVRDNGIGLAADQLEAIFELFVQVDTSLARSHGGLGLGLALVQQLVQMHGGRVEAHSSGLEQGSEFVIYLPLLVP